MGAKEVLVLLGFALIVGVAIGYFLSKNKKIANKFLKERREIDKVINNPEILLEKLKGHGKIIDNGEELHYSIGEKDGEKVIELNKTPYKAPKESRKQPSETISKKKKKPTKANIKKKKPTNSKEAKKR